jgi:hypothetical protein
VPFVPHLNHFWDFFYPFPTEAWVEWDMEWLRQCDALLRLPGLSFHSEKEVQEMLRLGRPVYYDIEGMLTDLAPKAYK